MPIGVFVNVVSVVLGGLFGALAGHKLPASLKTELNVVFGVCSMGIGISSIVLMKNMPAVIFAVVVGTAVGLACRLGLAIRRGAEWMQKPIARLFHSGQGSVSGEEFSSSLVTLVVLFCASGTGIYGTLTSGMTGDHTILIAKSVLDLFTAAVFACNLGVVVSAVAVPQLIVFLALFFCAKLIFPLTTPDMIDDFKACGGILMLATGFRMAKIKEFPVADMIPAMILVMPVSWLWSGWLLPLLS
ncbi:MAG: DUF554 domain-containing protein [Hydrogeniiclostridium sp.]